ncbi:MAG: Beta-1,3-glucosyltransferase, partial [uncultured Thermomicrobiales bacterium]
MPHPASPAASAPRVSVVIPTFRQEPFVRRALDSLLAQRFREWEAIVVDDGSPDSTAAVVQPYLEDQRVSLVRLPGNTGLGHALNTGLDRARGGSVAYLPTDDVWYADHLSTLVACLDAAPSAIFACSGVRHHYNRFALGKIEGEPLQLVQTIHRRTELRWLERSELTTDDLDRMFWTRLRAEGDGVSTGLVTCEWVDHPDQRHKLLRESEGGINTYRSYYAVRQPLRFQSSVGNYQDEVTRYAHYRERPSPVAGADGLKILLVGELAYNADRVLAFEERGHRLFGLWMERPYWYNAVGPLPFGNVEDIPFASWRDEVQRIKPDVIYALLNWQAVPFAHAVLSQNPGIPFVWHYKEGPFINLERGTWRELVELYSRADGGVYSSPEMRDWFATVLPEAVRSRPTLVLDGDLPKRDWFGPTRAPLLSDHDGETHTVVTGRPIGLHPETVAELAAEGIHLHFYGNFTHGQWRGWIERTQTLAPLHLHLHGTVDQERWTEEFSRYDAGWLHSFSSRNGGEIQRADWDDLNYPARMGTLAAAGVPMIQRDNGGSVVATQTLARDRRLGLLWSDAADLVSQ